MNQLTLKRFPDFSYAFEESINTLCTNLTFCGSDKKLIMLTSVNPHEGKSLLSVSMFNVLAQLGYKVLLVDCDLRRSQIAVRYGMKIIKGSGKGLSHYLAGMCSLDEILYKTDADNAYMIPVGQTVFNSLSLLSNPKIKEMFDTMRKNFDYVLVDAPPVGTIIDAAEIGQHCDGALLVVKYNQVSRAALKSAKAQIERSGCTVLGAVLNDVELDSISSKKYYNRNYYAKYVSDYYSVPSRKMNRKDIGAKHAE